MRKDTEINVRIPSELKEALRDRASGDERSMAWVVIEALKQYLSGGKKP